MKEMLICDLVACKRVSTLVQFQSAGTPIKQPLSCLVDFITSTFTPELNLKAISHDCKNEPLMATIQMKQQ